MVHMSDSSKHNTLTSNIMTRVYLHMAIHSSDNKYNSHIPSNSKAHRNTSHQIGSNTLSKLHHNNLLHNQNQLHHPIYSMSL